MSDRLAGEIEELSEGEQQRRRKTAEYCWGENEELVIQGLLAIDAAGSERRRGDLELPARLGQSVACAALSVVTPAAKPHLPPALLQLSPRQVQHHPAIQGPSIQAVGLRFFFA